MYRQGIVFSTAVYVCRQNLDLLPRVVPVVCGPIMNLGRIG